MRAVHRSCHRSLNPVLFFLPWLLGSLTLISSVSRADETVKISIIVTTPKDTDANATLYLAGNLKEAGEWKADGVKLSRQPDGTYKINLTCPKGQTLEYKINRGSWETVEKNEKGEEIENRTLKFDTDKAEEISVKSWAKKSAAAVAHTISGDVRVREHFASKILGNERTILVWLPPGYDANLGERYPVLYLHDGQNCFDAATSFAGEWNADETAGRLIADKKMQPIIMVAIANAGARMEEYTPSRDPKRAAGGKGELYARFLIEEVKPMIDARYRTLADRDNTAVAGSSLGGLISLYLGYQHGDVFSKCGVMSPSLFWDDSQLLKSIQSNSQSLKREKLWLDIGTNEGSADESGDYVAKLDTLADVLKTAGMTRDVDFVSRHFEGARHNEQAWSARFGDVLQFLFSR